MTFRIPIPDRRMVAGGVALVVFGVALFTAVVGWVVFFTLSPLGGFAVGPTGTYLRGRFLSAVG